MRRTPIGLGSLVVTALVLGACLGQRGDANRERLNALKADSLLRCQVDNVKPLKSSDQVGTTHGIGFGGTGPTKVVRTFSLNGADPVDVMTTLADCARASGWQVTQGADDSTLIGSKIFPGGWTAGLLIAVGPSPYRADIDIQLSTDGV
jgi:hypothetical protein